MVMQVDIIDNNDFPSESTADISFDTQATIKLKARRTLDDHILISDHHEIDIVIAPEKRKIITFPKKESTGRSYAVQDDFYRYLMDRGCLVLGSVQGGSLFGSLEAIYPEGEDKESVMQSVLLNVAKFLKEEGDAYDLYEKYQEEVEDFYTEPEEDETTELGKVPQKKEKGSIREPYGYHYGPYGAATIYGY